MKFLIAKKVNKSFLKFAYKPPSSLYLKREELAKYYQNIANQVTHIRIAAKHLKSENSSSMQWMRLK